MGGVVSDVVGGVGDLVGGAVDTVKDVASSDLGKAALIGGGLYATGGLGGLGLGGGTALTGVDAAMADLAAGGSGFGAAAGGGILDDHRLGFEQLVQAVLAFFERHAGRFQFRAESRAERFALAQKDANAAVRREQGGSDAAFAAAEHGDPMGEYSAHRTSGV